MMVPECNGTHYFSPCQQMCDSMADKCNPYVYAPQSLRQCNQGADFEIFNCQMLPFDTFVNDDESDVRCLIEKMPETTSTAPPSTTRQGKSGLLGPGTDRQFTSVITTPRPDLMRRPTSPSTTPLALSTESTRTTTKPSKSRNGLRQASFIAYRDCVQQNVVDGAFFYNICEWIRQFIRWRWRTFKAWTIYTKDISLELYELPQPGTCWANIRGCPKRNQVRGVTCGEYLNVSSAAVYPICMAVATVTARFTWMIRKWHTCRASHNDFKL